MPRSSQSREHGILSWFRSADLAQAKLVFSLVKGEIAEREHRSQEAKDRAEKAKKQAAKATTAAAPSTHERHVAAGKKAAATRKRRSRAKTLPGAPALAPVLDEFEINP